MQNETLKVNMTVSHNGCFLCLLLDIAKDKLLEMITVLK